MIRVKLLSSYYAASLDKRIFERYRNKEISKEKAIKEIEHNNCLEKGELPEEYFDYLFQKLGYASEDEEETA